jgi:hypothetical protein
METKISIISLILAILTILTLSYQSYSDDEILIGYGDHFEMVCGDDGLVDVCHVLLATANVTKNATCEATYSFEGTIEGNVSYKYDPEIYRHDVLYKSENGTSVIFVNISATLRPLEFTKLELKYTVSDLLKESNGSRHFKHVFNTDSVSPAEIVLKIPKPPTQFHKLVVESIVPAPHLFMEESHYYVLVWKSPLFKFGGTSTTYVDVSYRTVLNPDSVVLWVTLVLIGVGLDRLASYIWGKYSVRRNHEKEAKKSENTKKRERPTRLLVPRPNTNPKQPASLTLKAQSQRNAEQQSDPQKQPST